MKRIKTIPLSEPYIIGNEITYIKNSIQKRELTFGKYCNLFNNSIKKLTKSKYSILCSSGTAALHISMKVAGVKEDDEVIVPTLTFIATINSIAYNNASPIFMDTDDYFNLDEDKSISFIKKNTYFKNGYSYNKKTKKRISALIIVHVWGNAAKVNKLIKLCRIKNIKVIEDATESLGTFYKKNNKKYKHTGTIGDLGCISFNGNKIITAAGGGAIISNNKKYIEKANYYINQSKDNELFYIHNEIGFNYRLSNVQSAIGFAQLKSLNKIINYKKKIRDKYINAFKYNNNFAIYSSPDYSINNNWMNLLKLKKINKKYNVKSIISYLIKNKVQARPIWQLNHKQKMYKKCQTYNIYNANNQINNSICLPSSATLKNFEINKIINLLINY